MLLLTGAMADHVNPRVSNQAIVVLTEANFSEFIARHKRVGILFFRRNCGPCVRALPRYNQLASRMIKALNPFPLAIVDLDRNPVLAIYNDANDISFITLAKKDLFYEYNVEEFLQWLDKYVSVEDNEPTPKMYGPSNMHRQQALPKEFNMMKMGSGYVDDMQEALNGRRASDVQRQQLAHHALNAGRGEEGYNESLQAIQRARRESSTNYRRHAIEKVFNAARRYL